MKKQDLINMTTYLRTDLRFAEDRSKVIIFLRKRGFLRMALIMKSNDDDGMTSIPS